MHIADCINRVIDDFNGFLKTNKAVALNHEATRKVTTLKVRFYRYANTEAVATLLTSIILFILFISQEMSNAMKDMPQFQEMFAKVCFPSWGAKTC